MLTARTLTLLADFQQNATNVDFELAFGSSVGAHLWYKHATFREQLNLLLMWNQLSSNNRANLIEYIQSPTEAVFNTITKLENQACQ